MKPSRALAWICLLLLAEAVYAQKPAALWVDVPFVRQPKDGCGAASISMVMQYWSAEQGTAASPASDVTRIQNELYSPREHGIASSSVQSYLQRHGFLAFTVNGTWNDLQQQLEKGRPLIAALKPQGQTELHYVVIDGIDLVHALVMINDPAERKLLTQERAGFEKAWSATHNWMLLAVPAPPSR